MHGSDSACSATREARFFFPDLPPDPEAPGSGGGVATEFQQGDAAWGYVSKELTPSLVKALTAAAKAKPSSEKVGAAQRRAAQGVSVVAA